jgi:hypothetical protein
MRRIVETLQLPVAEAEARASLVASRLIGLVTAHYVPQVEPLASAGAEPDAQGRSIVGVRQSR